MRVTHRPNRPDLLRAGGCKAGDNRQKRSGTQAPIVWIAAPVPPRSRSSSAPVASSLRAPASSDDARIAPIINALGRLAQVSAPSDGLSGSSSIWIAQGGLVPPAPCGISTSPRRNGVPPSLGLMAHLDGRASKGKDHRRQERVQPWQAMENSAQIGRGVPSSLQFPQRRGVRDEQKHSPGKPHTIESK